MLVPGGGEWDHRSEERIEETPEKENVIEEGRIYLLY